jgi:branched-chain amino acid transport system substrate-binding protein
LQGRSAALFGSAIAVLLLVAVTGCGGSSSSGGKVSGSTLTVYSSLPLQGASRVQGAAEVNGIKLALKNAQNKVGKYSIKYVSLDDSTAAAGKWDPGQTSTNARKAASDKTTIAYIGEFNSGASAISIPILNRAGIGQISPANTAVGLTAKVAGAEPGEPEKYYPTGKRTYTRVVPKDTVQAAADATVLKADGCKKPFIVNDKEVYGAGLATNAVDALKAQGIPSIGNEGWDPKAPNYRSLASSIKSKGADCVFISGIVNNNAVQLTKDLASALPTAQILGPDGVCTATYTDPKQGGIPAALDDRVQCTVATLDPKKYPPEGQQFFSLYKKTYPNTTPDPYAIYGYESMSLALDAVKRAGANGNNRQDVIDALFNTKNRSSVLGTYSIDKNGDTSITDYGLYKIVGGQPTFLKVIKGTPAAGTSG